MKVPFQDLPLQTLQLRGELHEAIGRVLDHCQFIQGPEVAAFEREFAAFCRTPHAIGVSSGTDAIELAIRALGIGPGDEVITAANSFIASASAIAAAGARPVLVDCDEFYLMDPAALAAAITPRTRAVLPVHLYGQPANLLEIGRICSERGLALIEDAAQAHGAELTNSQRCGALGRLAAFSFYPGKNLGAFGDAGAITTADPALARSLAVMRNWGSERKYYHDTIGFNRRLDALQAAILGTKLRHLEQWTAARRNIANRYRQNLGSCEEIELPREAPWCGVHVYHLFVIRLRDADRQTFMDRLAAAGVQTQIHYPVPIHLQKCFAWLGYQRGAFPRTEAMADHLVSLPMFPEMTREQCDFVCEQMRSALR